ncbi:pseudouridine synthase, partial [Rhizobium ruizarguesonis]
EVLRATAARRLRQGDRNSWLEVELAEGRNRQIRRMLAALGTECLRLVRVALGGLELGELPKGAVRALSEPELHALRRKTGMERTRRN